MGKYTSEELDYVIDALDLGYMRNRIKSSEDEQIAIMNTFMGVLLLARFRVKQAFAELFRRKP